MEYMLSPRRIYLSSFVKSEKVKINDRDIVHKIKDVLRLKPGDKVSIFDGEGREYGYVLEEVNKNCLTAGRGVLIRSQDRPPQIWLGFPLLSEQKNDFILQKATELGATRLYPFVSRRSSLCKKVSPAKTGRWQKIVIEACRQSQRLWLPVIEPLRFLPDLSEAGAEVKLYGDREGSGYHEKTTDFRRTVMVISGPEGGFSCEEKDTLEKQGFSPVQLSSHVLRAETAAIFMVGLVSYLTNKQGLADSG